MPVIIEELTTTLEIEDEAQIRKLVRQEIERALREQRRGHGASAEADPADPAAAGGVRDGGS